MSWQTLAKRLARPGRWRYLGAALVVTGATGAMLPAQTTIGVLNILLIYLLVSFALALTLGAGPAAFGAVTSFLAFNFFFIPPFHTLSVAQPDHILALFIYLGIAIVTGQLVARVQARTEATIQEQRRTALLAELNTALIGDVTLDAILATIVERVVHVYGARQSRILLQDDDGILVARASFPPAVDAAIDRQRLALATWALVHRTPAGRTRDARRIRPPHGLASQSVPLSRRGSDVLYLPIATAERAIGVLEVAGKPGGGTFGREDTHVLTNFANQAALALERARLSDEAARAAALAQSDELKSALLAAVSHDLRTPLAVIKAAATSLLDPSVEWDDAARTEFLRAIDEETDRLTLLIGNLLDLSRIEGGALQPDRQWYDVAELVVDVVGRLSGRMMDHPLTTTIAPALPLACFDYVKISQALINLIENAIKYTPPGTLITISAQPVGGAIELSVADRGPGIPPSALPRIFDKFYRVRPNQGIPGAGIGLAISKGVVEAHGGRMWAESRVGSGTTIHFTLPVDSISANAEQPA